MNVPRPAVIAVLTLVAAGAALAGCGGSDSEPTPGPSAEATPTAAETAASAPAGKWTRGYPDTIALLGHSGGTGENSDPDQPGVEVRENSWATGANPDVDSVYQRILERNPAIEGHNLNYSEGGAGITMVAAQADRLLADDPGTDLILVQVMDNDLTCPLDRTALAEFRAQLTETLRTLSRGAPDASQFVVSQFGSVLTTAKALTRAERASWGGAPGPCATATATGTVVPKKVSRLEKAIHAYEGALEAACSQVRQCAYDGGVLGRVVDRREYLSSDLTHLSVEGHAKTAAVVWAAMRRAGVLPR